MVPTGFYTPAPVFRSTDLIERLHAEGVRFTVEDITKKEGDAKSKPQQA